MGKSFYFGLNFYAAGTLTLALLIFAGGTEPVLAAGKITCTITEVSCWDRIHAVWRTCQTKVCVDSETGISTTVVTVTKSAPDPNPVRKTPQRPPVGPGTPTSR
jgi:hypothetical protein